MAVLALMASTLAYATDAIMQRQDSPTLTFLALLFNGMASIGSVVWIAKRYVVKVDMTVEIIPKLVAAISTIEKAIESHTRRLGELDEGQNDHEQKLIRIDTVQDLRGCKKIIEKSVTR